MQSYSQSFLVHYLDKLVYPDISPELLTAAGVGVCAINLGIYFRRLRQILGNHGAQHS
jgi:hypothetical protein